jgi:nucleotide-binding universal stress UspA family protein
MEKKILIAVDDSQYAKNALSYAAGILTRTAGYRCTLIHVLPTISHYLMEEARTNPRINETIKLVIDENTIQSKKILEKAKEIMVRAGIAPEAVETLSHLRMQGLAKDIIEYARKHLFDAIVVGRRGLSRLQLVFMGSVSAKLVEHSADVPVWVVDGNQRAERILVAIDNSPMSMEIVDYLCGICGGIKDVQLIFYHVPHAMDDQEMAPLVSIFSEIDSIIARNEKHLVDIFWPEATRRLRDAKIPPEQVEFVKPVKTAKIGKMILEAAATFNCDTIVIGRRGSHEAYYFGSVSRYITERSDDFTIWVVS